MKIFILEDREENIAAAKEGLRGHELVIARSYQEGIEKLQEGTSPAFAIIDIHFPAEEGGKEEALGQKFKEEVLFEREFPVPTITMSAGYHGNFPSTDIYFEIKFQSGGRIGPSRVYTTSGDTKEKSRTWEKAADAFLNPRNPSMRCYIAAMETLSNPIKWDETFKLTLETLTGHFKKMSS
mgnify:CR=1 FL=1